MSLAGYLHFFLNYNTHIYKMNTELFKIIFQSFILLIHSSHPHRIYGEAVYGNLYYFKYHVKKNKNKKLFSFT